MIYSFFSERPFDQNLGSPLIYLFHLQTNIQQKYEIFFHFFFSLCTTIRPKIRVIINLIFVFVHDHLTKVRGYSYSLIHTFLNCTNISSAVFLAVLPLRFVRYIQSSASYPYISCSIFMKVLLLHISYAISMAIGSLNLKRCKG